MAKSSMDLIEHLGNVAADEGIHLLREAVRVVSQEVMEAEVSERETRPWWRQPSAPYWARIYSTNSLERLNKEVGRRTDVVGIFPDESSAQRLVGSVLMEIDDEWQVGRRYFSQESMRKLTQP